MTKDKQAQDDLFLRGARLRARQQASGRELHFEANQAGKEDLFRALIAAVAVIAHADGKLDLPERRKLVEAFLTSPAIAGFSVGELAEELADFARIHDYDPSAAERRALATLSVSVLQTAERQFIRNACYQVITADGLVHAAELAALHRIELALGLEGKVQ
jgi:tellurite resistance protein